MKKKNEEALENKAWSQWKIKHEKKIKTWCFKMIEESNLVRSTIIKKCIKKFGPRSLRIYNKVESQILD